MVVVAESGSGAGLWLLLREFKSRPSLLSGCNPVVGRWFWVPEVAGSIPAIRTVASNRLTRVPVE